MANFKEQVAAFEGGEKPRLADSSSYKPEIDVIIKFLGSPGALQANIDGSHRREAKLMVKRNYPEIYETKKGIRFTSDKMYIGLSPEFCRYMSMRLNEACHAVAGDTSMHKLMLVDDIKHGGDKGPMAVTHTNAEWLAMIETWRFRDLVRQASTKVMNAIDTAKGMEAIRLLTPDEPARNWGNFLSDHIIDWDVEDKVSGQEAAARLDTITKFRAKVDDLGPTGFPRKFQDLFKGAHRSGPLMVLLTPLAIWEDMESADCLTPLPVREHIAATNTNIRSEAYRIKNHMPDLVISFFTEFALLACAPELIAISAPNISDELWISMKSEEVDKDYMIYLNKELCKTCIVEGDFKAPATKQAVAGAMSAVRARKATVYIADALFGAGSLTCDSKDDAWGTDDFNDLFAFAKQDTPTR
eukprot:jgi/Tetstr1/443795/TSEL_031783.t1